MKQILLLILVLTLFSCTKEKVYYCMQIHYTSQSFDTSYFNIKMNPSDYNNYIKENNKESKCNYLFTKCY